MSTEEQTQNRRAEYQREYYEKNKERLKQQMKEYYLKKEKTPSNGKRGRKPGPVGSYKQKWIEEGKKVAAAADGAN